MTLHVPALRWPDLATSPRRSWTWRLGPGHVELGDSGVRSVVDEQTLADTFATGALRDVPARACLRSGRLVHPGDGDAPSVVGRAAAIGVTGGRIVGHLDLADDDLGRLAASLLEGRWRLASIDAARPPVKFSLDGRGPSKEGRLQHWYVCSFDLVDSALSETILVPSGSPR